MVKKQMKPGVVDSVGKAGKHGTELPPELAKSKLGKALDAMLELTAKKATLGKPSTGKELDEALQSALEDEEYEALTGFKKNGEGVEKGPYAGKVKEYDEKGLGKVKDKSKKPTPAPKPKGKNKDKP